MYELVSTAQHAARHSIAQHHTAPHRGQGTAPHGTARHGAELRRAGEVYIAGLS